MMRRFMWKSMMAAGVFVMLGTGVAMAGAWEQSEVSWHYRKDDGAYAKYEWIQDGNDWYYFGRFEDMKTNQLIDGYYVGADGKMVSKEDTENPINGVTVYGTCYMQARGYEDRGDHYAINVSLYDSSFGSNEMLAEYSVGDKFWIEDQNAYGTVTNVTVDTGGNVYLTVKYKTGTYDYSAEDTFVSWENEGEGFAVRQVKDNVQVMIPKNLTVIPCKQYAPYGLTLEQFLNNDSYSVTPVFQGNRVNALYDAFMNHAG